MHITLDVNVRFIDPENTAKLDAILAELRSLKQKESSMFEDLAAKILTLDNAADDQTAVLTDVKAKLDAALANPALPASAQAELQAISDGLGSETAKIVAATLANTPAASQVPAPAA